MIDIRMLGSSSLNKKLNRLERKVAGDLMKRATKTAMIPVLAEAKSLAPVGKTGLLKKNITIVVHKGRGNIGASVATGTRSKMRISADAKYYYPAAVERGTRKMRPRPFLREALFKKRRQALGILKNEIKQLLKFA